MLKKLLFIVMAAFVFIFNTKAQVSVCNAGFQFVQTQPGTVNFYSAMPVANFVTHDWNFGDNTTSTLVNPVHVYNTAGVYVVKHKVKKTDSIGNLICIDSFIQSIAVSNSNPCNLQANFNFTRDSINRKLFHFSNTTLNGASTDSVRWNFGDGTPFAYGNNVSHLYTNYGVYTVCLRVKRNVPGTTIPCVSEICKTIVVDSLVTVTCNAGFSVNVQGLTVTAAPFMNPPNAIHTWQMGNGFITNTPIPTYTYSTPGTYVIKHKITIVGNSNTTSCTDSTMQTVTVSAPCNLQANYSFTRDSLNRKKYYFTNTSVNANAADTVRWNFGDGTPFAYGNNVNHTYANYGTYTVCMRISRPTLNGIPCVKEICKTVFVDSLPNTISCTANFTYAITGSTANFTSAMQGATVQHQWSFGNGATSTAANPSYTYASGGVYNIKHIVKIYTNNTTYCIDSVVKTITITNSNPCNLQANFVYAADPVNKKKIYFTNNSLGYLASDSIRWNFGDGSPFNYTNNPTHTYAVNGVYTVCLRIKRTTASGTAPCVSEVCKVIFVSDSSITTSPCTYNVSFTMQRDSTSLTKVYFTNTSQQAAGAVATWYFGDGTTATGWNVWHNYPSVGTYQPCLRVTYSNTCIKTVCKVLQLNTNAVNCVFNPYPNPATNVVNGTVHLTQPQIIYTRIYNSQNFIVRQQQQQGFTGFNTVTANVSTLPFGLYRMEIQYGNKVCKGIFIKQ
jgi:PKD repeat protein